MSVDVPHIQSIRGVLATADCQPHRLDDALDADADRCVAKPHITEWRRKHEHDRLRIMTDLGPETIVVLIADAVRLRAIRDAAPFPYHLLYFTDSNLESALGSIRAHDRLVVALDTQFVHSDAGREFVERLEQLSIARSAVRIVSFVDGQWTMKPLAAPVAEPRAAALIPRRAPRFPVTDPLQVVVNGAPTRLIDMSVMGAQILSEPKLRPKQRIRITLPDQGDAVLQVTAQVAWSAFETPKGAGAPFYRAGLEFTDVQTPALEGYCRRHCSGEPVPQRL